jgi:hypothetical protein
MWLEFRKTLFNSTPVQVVVRHTEGSHWIRSSGGVPLNQNFTKLALARELHPCEERSVSSLSVFIRGLVLFSLIGIA